MTIQSDQAKAEASNWQTQVLEYCLRIGNFFCFAGWAWGHLYWEPSYASILWSEASFEWFQQFGYSWEEFTGTGANDGLIQKCIQWIGWICVANAVLSFTARRNSWIQLCLLTSGSLFMLAIAVAKYIRSGFELPMLIEQGGQILSPILLVMALSIGVRNRITTMTAIIAVMMTFGGHGLYAVGLWPTPATFVGMTRVVIGWDYDSSKLFLLVAGVLDFIVCFGVLIPFLRRSSALYAMIWGIVTAAARPVAGMSWELNYWGADQFLHESAYRSPHFFIPLFLYLYWTYTKVQHSFGSLTLETKDMTLPSTAK